MAEMQNKINTGVLFKNKKDKDSQPDYTGTVELADGTKRLAAWVKKSQNGTAYMSIQISDMQPRQESAPTQPAANNNQAQNAQPAGNVGGSYGDMPF